MASYLLDTHVFLWMISDKDNLSDKSKRIVENINNKIYLSVASLWEISIKYSINKLVLPEEPEVFILNEVYEEELLLLQITPIHALRVHAIPQIHKDPFDRLLITQSITDSIPLISSDETIGSYRKVGLNLVW